MLSNDWHGVDVAVRTAAVVTLAAALLVLLTHSAVTRRVLSPFGWWPRFVRGWSDPLLRPIERRLHAAGANPQDAPLWFLGVTLIAGLLAIAAVRWIVGSVALLGSMRNATPQAWLRLAVVALTSFLSLAIIVRVIGGWLGAGRYRRWMRPVYAVTDWLIEPIRRRLPPFGPLDLSPFLAYLLVLLVRSVLLGVLDGAG